MSALTRILKRRGVKVPRLLDYEVRIPKGGKVDALTECVITWGSEQGSYKTRGVRSNQVVAAVNATIRMLNMQSNREQQEPELLVADTYYRQLSATIDW